MEDLERSGEGIWYLRECWMDASSPSEKIEPPVSHVYRPLSSEKPEFRVVELLPSNDFESPITCRLLHGNLEDPPEYEAVSYAWGKPEFIKAIELESRPFYVTENLELALRYLRLPFGKRAIWADALCINQTDAEERSQQVRLMRDIFRFSKAGLVWLGPYPFKATEDLPTLGSQPELWLEDSLETLKRGMEVMEKIRSSDITALREMSENMESHIKEKEWFEEPVEKDETTRDQLPPDETPEDEKPVTHGWLLSYGDSHALGQVLERSPVWNRVWIMQEVSCAPRVVLVAGRSVLDWSAVASFLGNTPYADAFHAPFGHGIVGSLVWDVFSTAQIIEHQRRIVSDLGHGYVSKLLDVLVRFRYTVATDPRDKIYGLLGLVSEQHGIRVDYRKTSQQVFIDVATSLIDNSATLDILCQSPWSDMDDFRMAGLPSWVPDFTRPGHPISLFAQRSIFCAGDLVCEVPCRVSDQGMLSLEGIALGRVGPILAEVDSNRKTDQLDTHTAKRGSDELPFETLPRKWMLLYFGNRLIGSDGSTYASGEPCLQAYWRTLVVDCKCFPIERLNEEDLKTCGKTFDAVLRQNEPDERICDLECWKMLCRTLMYWTFTITDNGFYIMVMAHAKEGDLIAVLDGAKVPVVLRPAEGVAAPAPGERSKYNLISTAYVHGFMDGEAKKWAEEGRLKAQDFLII